MILHNDIWGDTSVTLIEEINNQFLIVRELNMLALYSRLNKEQSHALQQALATFYEILFSSKDKDKIDDTVPFTPDISFDDDGNGYLCLVRPMQDNSVAGLKGIKRRGGCVIASPFHFASPPLHLIKLLDFLHGI